MSTTQQTERATPHTIADKLQAQKAIADHLAVECAGHIKTIAELRAELAETKEAEARLRTDRKTDHGHYDRLLAENKQLRDMLRDIAVKCDSCEDPEAICGIVKMWVELFLKATNSEERKWRLMDSDETLHGGDQVFSRSEQAWGNASLPPGPSKYKVGCLSCRTRRPKENTAGKEQG